MHTPGGLFTHTHTPHLSNHPPTPAPGLKSGPLQSVLCRLTRCLRRCGAASSVGTPTSNCLQGNPGPQKPLWSCLRGHLRGHSHGGFSRGGASGEAAYGGNCQRRRCRKLQGWLQEPGGAGTTGPSSALCWQDFTLRGLVKERHWPGRSLLPQSRQHRVVTAQKMMLKSLGLLRSTFPI